MGGIEELDARAITSLIQRGEKSAEEVVLASLARISKLDPQVHAFREVAATADAVSEALGSGRTKGSLQGVPVAVKEIFDVRGMHCSWGTAIHRTRVPQQDSVAVARLRAAGAVILGTTISTEYAIGAAGPTTNPHDASRTPGGSSSGSAAAVAAGMVPVALGSQTVGSIIRPATFCGVYGLKPTHGAIDVGGVMPLSEMLDHIGVLARTPADIALVCRILFDRTSDWVEMAAPSRVHLVRGPMWMRVESASHTALERARAALSATGASVSSTELPADFENAASWLDTILCRDIAVNHGGDRDRVGDEMSPKLRALVDRGRATTSAQYIDAVEQSLRIRESLLRLLDDDSIILAAATDGVAPMRSIDGTGAPQLQGLYTMAGLPALAVPCGTIRGLPVGVQLVAAPGREGMLIAAANAMQCVCQPPPLAEVSAIVRMSRCL